MKLSKILLVSVCGLLLAQTNIKKIGSYPIGRILSIAADDKFIYYGSGGILHKWNISTHRTTATITTDGVILSTKIKNNLLYIANGNSGITIIDKETLKIIKKINTGGTVYDLLISSNYAYIAAGEKGVIIMDIQKLKLIKNIKTGGTARNIAIHGKFLYVADGEAGICVINLENLKIVKTYNLKALNGYAYNISVDNNYGYIATGDTLEIIEISKELKFINSYKPKEYGLVDIIKKDNLIYAALSTYQRKNSGVAILDVSNPLQIKEVKVIYAHNMRPLKLYLRDNLLFCACGTMGFSIINLSTKEKIPENHYIYSGASRGIVVDKNYAFLSTLRGKTYIIDVSIPTSPKCISTIGYGSSIFMCIEGKFLYSGSGDVFIHNISNIKSPKCISRWYLREYHGIGGIHQSGNYVYTAMSRKGIAIVDVSDPKRPKLVARHPMWYVYDVFCKNGYLYGIERSGLYIIDVSSPSSPKRISSLFGARAGGVDVFVEGKYAYIAGGSLKIVDVSDPYNPKQVSFVEMNSARQVFVSGKYAYVCDLGSGLRVIDVGNPLKPFEVGFYPTQGTGPWGVYVKNDMIYLADGEYGLVILTLRRGKIKKKLPKLTVGVTTPPSGHLSPMGYYNKLAYYPFDYLIQRKRVICASTIIGIFDNSKPKKGYIPFTARGGNIGYVGCGTSPFQEDRVKPSDTGTITILGMR